MGLDVQPVYRPRQQVEQQIRAAIVSKRLEDGDRLPSEATLADEFGVSRSTIREALRSLAAAGLIEKSPGAGGGSFVRKLDTEAFARMISESVELFVDLGNARREEVAALRDLLEVPSARMAATNRSDDDVALLYKIIEAQKAATVDDPEVPQLDVNFHAAIAEASGNRLLAAFVLALHSVTQPVRGMKLSKKVGKETVAQHLAVVKAIEAGDADKAEAAVRGHLDYLRTTW